MSKAESKPRKLRYCISCDHVLVGDMFKYCGESDCPRYGLYTALSYEEQNKSEEKS